MMDGALRLDGRRVVATGSGSTEDVLDLDTQRVASRPASGALLTPDATRATSPDGKWTVKNGENELVYLEDVHTNELSTLDLAGDAFVWLTDGAIAIGGDASSARCRVDSVWLPLDACRDRLMGGSR